MLLGGQTSFISKATKNYLESMLIMKSGESTRPSTPIIDEFEVSTDEKLTALKSVLGDEFPLEKLRHFLHGADGNTEVALNHALNEVENRERSSNNNSMTTSQIMATSNATDKLLYELAEEVKCPLCLGYFNNPLTLVCFHTFCSSCLDDLVSSENRINCPLCRVVVELDERGVKALKQNHHLANIVEKLKSAQKTKMCDECRSSLCTVVCQQCKAFLCNGCNEKIHSIRLLYNHHRIPFDECFFTSKKPLPQVGFEFDVNWESDCVIPFNVKKEVCTDLFYSWVKELWFAPSDLARNAILNEFKMVYVPFWLFEVDTVSRYVIGYSDKLLGESQELGVNSQRYSDLLVCASNCPESSLLDQIEPWKVDQITNFTLKHAEGAEVRPFTMDADTSWRIKAKQKVDQLNREACRKKLRYRVRPDNVGRMHIDTSFENKKSKRLFIPVYSTTYEYGGRTYRFVVNGNTAKSFGHRPYSASKLASLSVSGFSAAVGLLTSARFNP